MIKYGSFVGTQSTELEINFAINDQNERVSNKKNLKMRGRFALK